MDFPTDCEAEYANLESFVLSKLGLEWGLDGGVSGRDEIPPTDFAAMGVSELAQRGEGEKAGEAGREGVGDALFSQSGSPAKPSAGNAELLFPTPTKEPKEPKEATNSMEPKEPVKPSNSMEAKEPPNSMEPCPASSNFQRRNASLPVSPHKPTPPSSLPPVSPVSPVSPKPSAPAASSVPGEIPSIPAGNALEGALNDEDLLQLLEIEEQKVAEGKAALSSEVDQIFASMENEASGENAGGAAEGGGKAVESSLREEQFRLSQEVSGHWSELSQLNNSVLQSVAPKGVNQTLSLDDMEDLMSEDMKQFFM